MNSFMVDPTLLDPIPTPDYPEHYSTGIIDLDNELEGGFFPGQVNMVSGSDTVFTAKICRFLANLAIFDDFAVEGQTSKKVVMEFHLSRDAIAPLQISGTGRVFSSVEHVDVFVSLQQQEHPVTVTWIGQVLVAIAAYEAENPTKKVTVIIPHIAIADVAPTMDEIQEITERVRSIRTLVSRDRLVAIIPLHFVVVIR